MNELLIVIIKSIFAYTLFLSLARLMGRKTISQMTFFDFGVVTTFGTLVATIALGGNTSTSAATAAAITYAILAVITGMLHIKSFKFRKIVDSEPVTVIGNGHIVEENMRKVRLSIDDLTQLLRQKNVFNIADVEFAILESDGKLSVLPKSQKVPVTPSDLNISTKYKGLTKDIIIDGNIMFENLQDAKLDEKWLVNQLANQGINSERDVFYAGLDTDGVLYVSTKYKDTEKPGQYGIE